MTPGFVFNENSRNLFIDGLTSQTTREKFNQILESNELTATNIAAEIKSILIINAQKCKLRTQKTPRKKQGLISPLV